MYFTQLASKLKDKIQASSYRVQLFQGALQQPRLVELLQPNSLQLLLFQAADELGHLWVLVDIKREVIRRRNVVPSLHLRDERAHLIGQALNVEVIQEVVAQHIDGYQSNLSRADQQLN